MLEVKVEGLRELDAALKKLPDEIEKKVLMQALYAGTQPIIKSAKAKAPVALKPYRGYKGKYYIFPGTMRDAIRAARGKKEPGTFRYHIGPMKIKGIDVFFWRFLEFGTKFISKRPFLGPGFDQSVERGIEVVKAALRSGIDRAVKKLGLER